ncbi:hypothetical protein CRYUN_Cryun28dG0058900 [Craigia yunnanensis]
MRLAKKYHPDANKNNPSAKRKFQEIIDAYETLQDSEKRREYDRMHVRSSENMEYGANDAQGFRFYDASGAQGFRYTYRTNFSDSFSKIFSEIFQEEMDQFAPYIQTELLLCFSEAARGCTKDLCFDAFVPCDSCDFLLKIWYVLSLLLEIRWTWLSLNAKVKICPTCRGTGTGFIHMIQEYCMPCQGSGVVEGIKEVKVTIPADYPVFARDGADVYLNSNISFTQTYTMLSLILAKASQLISKCVHTCSLFELNFLSIIPCRTTL